MVDPNLPLVKEDVLSVPSLQMLRLREVTQPAQSHTAGGDGDLNWLLSALRAGLLTSILCFSHLCLNSRYYDSEGGVSTSDSG